MTEPTDMTTPVTRGELRAELGLLKTELRSEMAVLRTELRAEMSAWGIALRDHMIGMETRIVASLSAELRSATKASSEDLTKCVAVVDEK